MNSKKIVLLMIFILVISALVYFDTSNLISFTNLKKNHDALIQYYRINPLVFTTVYFCLYVFFTAISFPAATVLTLLGASIFGFTLTTILVSFASTIGATLAFLFSRYLFRDIVERTFSSQAEKANRGLEKNGAFYLLSLRLIPVVPFFVINLVMGLTRIDVKRYFFVSQIAMLPATLVYVNAGTRLYSIQSIEQIMSPDIFISLSAIGFLPFIFRRFISKVDI